MSTSVPTNLTDETVSALYVPVSEYNKLKVSTEKLKAKNEKLMKEKKNLELMIEDMIKHYQVIKERQKSTDFIIQNLQEVIKGMTSRHSNKNRSEYSTTSSYIQYVSPLGTQTRKLSQSHNEKDSTISNNSNIEINSSESYENLSNKYKQLKEDLEITSNNLKKLEENFELKNLEYNNIICSLNEKENLIERYKEIEKCILESYLNILILNFNENKLERDKERDQLDNRKKSMDSSINSSNTTGVINNFCNNNQPYIICEPVPSYLKFLRSGTFSSHD